MVIELEIECDLIITDLCPLSRVCYKVCLSYREEVRDRVANLNNRIVTALLSCQHLWHGKVLWTICADFNGLCE